ncbi:MAG TPA: NUDIX domain-containing protein [Croceibacterium sp.]|nr:NUDIX domain-containing protein [Croceibacterium sp.]
MLHLILRAIPAPVHRRLYRIADWLRRRWWSIRKPRRHSVSVVAFDGDGRVLLVRHSYGPPVWALPGGGIDRGEQPIAAAAREFAEELRCPLADVRSLRETTQDESGALDRLNVFVAQVAGTPVPDMREIVAAGFFDPAGLPRPADRRVAGWVAEAVALRAGERRS